MPPLYHFTPARHALDDIRRKRLKVAQFDDLNDPFELRNVELIMPEDIGAFERSREQICQRFGLLCFSERWKSILQWSHYGDRHRGICLGFEVTYIKEKFGPVTYQVAKLEFPGKEHLDLNFMKKMLRTKYRGWEYEKEWRVFIELEDAEWNDAANRSLYFAEFGKELVLREVILGADCNMPLSEVQDALAGYSEPVGVSKIHLVESEFRLEKHNL